MLAGKKILLAVTGSIAAYKAAFFVRLLGKEGAEVQVVMTPAARDFISPLTLATLSKRPVYSEYYDKSSGAWHNHVELALWADLMVVAPATANTLAKLANGLCDDLLSAVYLSAKCPVMVAPAMDLDMYKHQTTLHNLDLLRSYGNQVIDAETGELASGLHGTGRMAEPEHLLEHVRKHFETRQDMAGKRVLITSGPTHEAIDPVRFIGNNSSGKMGRSLALEFASRGATVDFVSGPTYFLPSHTSVRVTHVNSADEMLETSAPLFDQADVVVFAAAVADYKPETVHDHKLKKKAETMTVTLVPTPDIAATLGQRKKKQLTVGFALETTDELVNAQDKLRRKNFDLIVLNSLNDPGAGFAHDTNKVAIFDRDNNTWDFGLKPKDEVARDIVNVIAGKLHA
jgi:phosphopantothenoylcysteine decarboxylase / phosphopantothenate---cysteine ligase